MSTEQSTESFDESVLEALRGHDRRYDVAIDGELVLAVQPNGVKTWTWVYDKETVPQRKTLGIYPDMSIEDAKKSLAAERAAHGDASPGPEFVIRDGRIETAAPAASQIPVLAGAAVAMIAVAALAWLFLKDDPDSSRNPPAAQLTMDKSIGSAADDVSSPFRETSAASDAGSIRLPQAQPSEDASQPEVSQTAATVPASPAPPDVRSATPVDVDAVPDDRQAIGEELRRLVTAESSDPLAKIAVRRSASPTVA
ncbi:MAG: Arm DNA-binding domain-containing protein, partial [Gammaproteobacteria bacterium]|nr:Arm DNA-binding domain-containing protein [Gammaproteobacteria bacterium]